jgi:RNA polymerase sigma-70 factor (sigma-E family)
VTTMGADIAERPAAAGELEELYIRHAPTAIRLAYFLSGDRQLAEDLVQEAFVRVAGRFRHLRVPDNFPAYLRRTIVNLHTSQLRRRRLERSYVARRGVGQRLTDPEDAAQRDELWRALQRLPHRQRAAVVLRYYEDLSEREAADVLGVSTGALNALVARATATLRSHIEGEDHEQPR